jgi:hypothetical protein
VRRVAWPRRRDPVEAAARGCRDRVHALEHHLDLEVLQLATRRHGPAQILGVLRRVDVAACEAVDGERRMRVLCVVISK